MTIRSIACLALLLSAPLALADEHPVFISGGRVPHVFDPDNPGPYNKVMDLMRAGLERPVEIDFFPMPMAMRQMSDDKYDCFAMALRHSPNWERLGLDPNQYVFVGPITWLNIKLYTRPGQAVPEVLSDDFVVATDGTISPVTTAFDGHWSDHQLQETESFVDALQLLADGAVHGVLAYDVDVRSLAADHPLHGTFIDAGVTIAEMEDGLMCKSTAGMLPVILGFQENLDKIAADGTLERILKQ